MRLFIGLDVSLAKTAVCAIDEHGKIVKEAQVPSVPEALERFVEEIGGEVSTIGLEAGPLPPWLRRSLTEAGLDVVLMETRQVKGALKAMPIKTDRRDAEGMPGCFNWTGSGRCTATPSPHRKFAHFSGRARRSNRA